MNNTAHPIDWSGIRAAAISLGSVNAAAKQAGANLPPDEAGRLRERINKRALRERWMDKSRALQTVQHATAKPLSNIVQDGAAILAKVSAERKERTHDKLSRYAEAAAEEAVNAPEKLRLSKAVRDVSAIYGALWPEQQQPGVNINLWGSGSMSAG